MRIDTNRAGPRKALATHIAAGNDRSHPVNWSGNCTDPELIFVAGHPDEFDVIKGNDNRCIVWAWVRCRKCPPCLHHRSIMWSCRGSQEIAESKRTWFGTLTLAPEHRVRGEIFAERLARTNGSDWSSLTKEERTALAGEHWANDLTRYIKRLRKKHAFRYLLVVEPHKDGTPHWHILIHETGPPIRKEALKDQWELGFTRWKLVPTDDPRPAFYVCKYLAKSKVARIRASFRYGRAPSALPREALRLADGLTPGEVASTLKPGPKNASRKMILKKNDDENLQSFELRNPPER